MKKQQQNGNRRRVGDQPAILRKMSSVSSLGLSAILLLRVKLGAWLLTGSVALLTCAVDALVDTASSLATYFGVRYFERPPDTDFRFGHTKGEAIAGFTQAASLSGAALVLAFQSGQRVLFPNRCRRSISAC